MKYRTNKGQDSQNPSEMTLYVRYMLSLRCKIITKDKLQELGIHHLISLQGGLMFPKGISKEKQVELKKKLKKSGLELLDENESMMIDNIISMITDLVHHTDSLPKISYKEIINEKLGTGDAAILKIFTQVTGVSITQFIVQQKVERAKELLLYHDFSVAEIAEKLNYKRTDLFISQFKKFTDLPPSYFSKLKERRLKAITAVA